ncbi:MAG: PAS domain S-box protein, partial [Synergistaceae bacterium]|nr:PAS domain S-box protein [Synergistaceae bacterium]
MKKRGFSHPVIALLAAVLLMFGVRSAPAEEKALSVLVLNSYHQGFAWTDGILEGIREAFGKKGMAADLSVEFMDTKRTFSVRTLSAFFDHFREKYFQKTFDVIICSDDDATAFLMRRGRELFPGVPVVFCGVNNPGLMNFDGAPPFAGVLEQVDIPGTGELIIRHFPNTKNLALVSDLSPSGMSVISQARMDLIPYLDRIAVTDLFGLSGADLQDEVSKLPPVTAILLLVYFQDARGEFYAPERTARLIKKACPFPVFGLWSMMIEGGCLGGSVLIPREHGARAGGLAVRILEGELPGDMPPETDRHPIPLFNYDEMKRFGLGRFTIPGGAKIVGEPETFFYRHRPFILINGLLGSAVLIYLASLLINERLARSAEKELRLRVVQWEGLFQNAPEAYALYNHSNEIITVNRGFTELFGYPHEEVAGKELDSVVADYPGINAEAKEISAKRFSGETIFAEGLRVRKDGSLFYAEIQGSAYPALDDHV